MDAYEKQREASRRHVVEASRIGRDIAPGYPGPGDRGRRESCQGDLRRFLETYFAAAFPLPWSRDHLLAIDRMQAVALEGGLFALAMPRGSGKTTISVRAALWALLYGHRRFVCLIGSTEEAAKQLLKAFKHELTFNAVLAADHRQVCYPLQRLENNARRCVGQLFGGQQTRIEWSADRLTFPAVPASALDGPDVGGSTLSVGGLTGSLRGQSHVLPDGRVIRPDLVMLDDPQTRESANSTSQSERRAQIVAGDVLGMAGPGRKIAAVMPCTVIRPDDLADRLLDRKRHPEWNGQKTRMVLSWPKDEDRWEEYRRIRSEGLTAGRGMAEATEFYRANRAAMDAGAEVSWPERHDEDELSGIQHAMNLRLRDEAAFFAEYQNEPLSDEEDRPDLLTADQIAAKLSRLKRGAVPVSATRLTAFVDVHQEVLYWCVAAWDDTFDGSVIDYGTYPDQKRPYFSLRDAQATLSRKHRGAGVEGRIFAGLEATCDLILGREWPRDDGTTLRVERCGIDANWGSQTDTVYQFCRESKHAAILYPSHGKGIGASGRPILEWSAKPGERKGLNWFLSGSQGKRGIRKVTFDANFWKSFVHARLSVPKGDRGSLSLFGSKASAHRLFADHLTAEHPVRTQRQGSSRVVDEWKVRPDRPDNHWFDCLVGCAVAASVLGVSLPESGERPLKRKRLTFDEMQKRARGI